MEKLIAEINTILREQESLRIRRRQDNLHRITMQELMLRHTLRETFNRNHSLDSILNHILDNSLKFNNTSQSSCFKESSLSSDGSFETMPDDSLYRKYSTSNLTQKESSSNAYNNSTDQILAYIQNVGSSIAASCTKAAIEATLENSLGFVISKYTQKSNSLLNFSTTDQTLDSTSQYSSKSFQDLLGLIDHIGHMPSVPTFDTIKEKEIPRKPSDIKKRSSSSSLANNNHIYHSSTNNESMEFQSFASILLKLLFESHNVDNPRDMKDLLKTQYSADVSSSTTPDASYSKTDSFASESFSSLPSCSNSRNSTSFLYKFLLPQLIQLNERIDLMEEELLVLYQERHLLNTLKELELNDMSFADAAAGGMSSHLFERLDSKLKSTDSSSDAVASSIGSNANKEAKKSKHRYSQNSKSLDEIIPPWLMMQSFESRSKNKRFRQKSINSKSLDEIIPPWLMCQQSLLQDKKAECQNITKNCRKTQNAKQENASEVERYASFERQLSEITRLLSLLRLDSSSSSSLSFKDLTTVSGVEDDEASSFHLGFLNSTNEWTSEELSALTTLANALKVKSEECVSLHHKKNRKAKMFKKKSKKHRKHKKKQNARKEYQKKTIQPITKEPNPETENKSILLPFFYPKYKMIKDGSIAVEQNQTNAANSKTDEEDIELCVVGKNIFTIEEFAPQNIPKVYQQYFITPAGFTIRILRTDSVESEE